jgi:hypothetical protein
MGGKLTLSFTFTGPFLNPLFKLPIGDGVNKEVPVGEGVTETPPKEALGDGDTYILLELARGTRIFRAFILL